MAAAILVPLFILASVTLEIVASRRCRHRIQEWAAVEGGQVESVKRLWFESGTSAMWGIWTGGRNRRYFNITVSDRTGSKRTGTAKVYGGFGGVVADEIEVSWSH